MTTLMATREGPAVVTEEEFLSCDRWDGYELVDGVPVEVPMGGQAAWIGGTVGWWFVGYAREHGGFALPQDTPFKAWPERPNHVRKPDTMYFAAGRFADGQPPRGVVSIAPDVAVEVHSPGDNAGDLRTKINEYLSAGVRLIWIIYPESRDVDVIRPSGLNSHFSEGDELSGEDVMPGLLIPLRDLFGRDS